MFTRSKPALVAFLAISFVASGPALAQTRYHNQGAKPFCPTSVGWQGWGPGKDWSARLCVMGHETMAIDPGPLPSLTLAPVSGAGFYEADAGSFYDIGTVPMGGPTVMLDQKECDCSLHVKRVEWDHDGKLVSITGLPSALIVDDKTKIAITSDVNNPKISNGNLYITLDGHGSREYWLTIKFGKIVAIGAESDKKPDITGANPSAGEKATGGARTSENSNYAWEFLAAGCAVGLLVIAIYVWQSRRNKGGYQSIIR